MRKVLSILTTNKSIEHNYSSVRIFTTKYNKKIRKNEFHCPNVAKLIIETEKDIFAYVINTPVIISDENRNIKIYAPSDYESICEIKSNMSKDDLARAKHTVKLLKNKQKLGISVDEVIEKHKNELILESEKVKKAKLSYEEGGGF